MIKVKTYKTGENSALRVYLHCDCSSGKIYKRKEGPELVLRCDGCNARTTASFLKNEASSFYWRSMPWELMNVEDDSSGDLLRPVSIPAAVRIYDPAEASRDLKSEGRIIKISLDSCAVLFEDTEKVTSLLSTVNTENILDAEIIMNEEEHEIEIYGRVSSVHPYGKSNNPRLVLVNYLFLRNYQKQAIEHLVAQQMEKVEEKPILIAVKDEKTVEIIKKGLEDQQDISYSVCSDLREILDVLKKKPYYLILLPFKTSWIDGFDWMTKIRAQNSIISFVFLFERSQQEMVIEAFRQGAEDCLIQPFTSEEFLTAIRKSLEKQTGRQAVITHEIELAAQLQEKTDMLARSFDALRSSFSKIETAYYETVQKLCLAAECHDEGTASHLRRISEYSKIIAQRLHWQEHKVEVIALASPMHDIGKVGISEHILSKCSGLTEDEWTEIYKHPEIGAKILRGSDSPILQMAEKISLQHHERYNGKGYPQGIKSDTISQEASIVNITDVFDSLTTKRPYKPPWPNNKAIDYIIEKKGEEFHPLVVEAFLEEIDRILTVQKQYREEANQFSKERRHNVRVPCDVQLSMKVLLPDETFTPKEMKAILFDLSEKGLGASTERFPGDFYNLLNKTTRYIEGKFQIPGSQTSALFRGKIAWIDNYSTYGNTECRMGIAFTKIDRAHVEMIGEYVEKTGKALPQDQHDAPAAQSQPSWPSYQENAL